MSLCFFFFKQKTAYDIMPSLVGSEMCIRDRPPPVRHPKPAMVRPPVPSGMAGLRDLQRGVRQRARGSGGSPRRRRHPGLPPGAGTRTAPPAAAGPADRALLAHAVGGPVVLPSAPGRRRPRATAGHLSLIHISEPTRLGMISYA